MNWRDSSTDSSQDSSPPAAHESAIANPPHLRRRPWQFWLIGGCLGVLALIGVACGALGGLAVGVYQFALHEPTVSAESLRTFAVRGAPQLVVTNPAGSVTLAPGDAGEARIEATRRARDRTEDDARKALGTITLDLRQDGEMITVVAGFSGPNRNWPGASRAVDLLITIPMSAGVTVHESAGDVNVGALNGPLSLQVDAGNVRVTGATVSGSSQIAMGAGNVTMDGALSERATLDVRIEAGNATITLPAATAAHIEAQTAAGDVVVRGWPIAARHTSGAMLLAAGDTHSGALARLTVEAQAGDILIQAR